MNGWQCAAGALRITLAAAACLAFAAPALAQNGATPPPAGAAFINDEPAGGTVVGQREAPSAASTACGAQNCLTLELSPEALRAVERGGDLADFAEGVSLAYEGANSPAVYFVAARYDNGRLTQYENTAWLRPEGAGAGIAFDGVAEAISRAANLIGQPPVALAPAAEGQAVWMTPVSMQGFVIESPRTYLIGDMETAPAPIDRMTVAPALASRVESGPVLFIAFVPSDYLLRTPEQTLGTGAVIPLVPAE